MKEIIAEKVNIWWIVTMIGKVCKESCSMYPEKTFVTPKANQDILKHHGGREMWMWLYVKRGIYLGCKGTVRKRKTERNIVRQRKMLRELFRWL